jgi:hypothetical protein
LKISAVSASAVHSESPYGIPSSLAAPMASWSMIGLYADPSPYAPATNTTKITQPDTRRFTAICYLQSVTSLLPTTKTPHK